MRSFPVSNWQFLEEIFGSFFLFVGPFFPGSALASVVFAAAAFVASFGLSCSILVYLIFWLVYLIRNVVRRAPSIDEIQKFAAKDRYKKARATKKKGVRHSGFPSHH